MEGKKEIQIDKSTKGKIVHIDFLTDTTYWIVFISHIEQREHSTVILRHASIYNFGEGNFEHWEYISEKPEKWGPYVGCKIYEATEEEKQRIKDLIKNRGFRYAKVLNKLIKR